MRNKAFVVAAVALCFSAAVPVEAARPRRDMARYHYMDNNHHVGGPGFGAGTWDPEQAYAFDLQKGERSVSVMVLDDNERPVSAVIVQIQWDGDYGAAQTGHAVTHEAFCGRTEAPVPVCPISRSRSSSRRARAKTERLPSPPRATSSSTSTGASLHGR